METEKHRIVLTELEQGWWILAVWDTLLPLCSLLTTVVYQPDPPAQDQSLECLGFTI